MNGVTDEEECVVGTVTKCGRWEIGLARKIVEA